MRAALGISFFWLLASLAALLKASNDYIAYEQQQAGQNRDIAAGNRNHVIGPAFLKPSDGVVVEGHEPGPVADEHRGDDGGRPPAHAGRPRGPPRVGPTHGPAPPVLPSRSRGEPRRRAVRS